jgi:GTP pyrophosphokinase
MSFLQPYKRPLNSTEISMGKKMDIVEKAQTWLVELTDSSGDPSISQQALDWILNQKLTEDILNDLLTQGLQLSQKMQQYHSDPLLLASALTYPFIKYYKTIKGTINHLSPSIVALTSKTIKVSMIDQLSQINNRNFLLKNSQNLRKLMLAIVEDPKAVIIKLIECLCTLHNLKDKPSETQQQFAERVMQLYAPLANRLGLGQIKWELEDLAFRYIDKDTYFEISKALKIKRKDRESVVVHMKKKLKEMLEKSNIKKAEVDGRVKHIYSISKKMKRKDSDFTQIYDTTALRILVANIQECYSALDLIHAQWKRIPEEFDDYIANPKPNGYQSLHTAIETNHFGIIEIQIRTQSMHITSERGVAAHWKYKEQPKAADTYQDKINLLRQLINWQQGMANEETIERFNSIVSERIYVFTPEGEVMDLANKATPLDFAYRVHTQIGHRCRGAKINGKLEPLTTSLNTGDKIEILVSNIDRPSRDWLNLKSGYLTTSHAINKVKQFFRKENYNENLIKGQQLWEKAQQKHKLDKKDLHKIPEKFNFLTLQDLIAAIGSGDISIKAIVNKLEMSKESPAFTQAKNIEKSQPIPFNNSQQFYIDGITGFMNHIAQCCNPIPGDKIIAYTTKTKGISIHKETCSNIENLRLHNPERLIDANWNELQKFFFIRIYIKGIDRKGLVHDISNKLIQHDCKLLRLSSKIDEYNGTAEVKIELQLNSLQEYKKVEQSLQQIQGILNIYRQ